MRAWVSGTDGNGDQLKATPADIVASQRVLRNGYFNEVTGTELGPG